MEGGVIGLRPVSVRLPDERALNRSPQPLTRKTLIPGPNAPPMHLQRLSISTLLLPCFHPHFHSSSTPFEPALTLPLPRFDHISTSSPAFILPPPCFHQSRFTPWVPPGQTLPVTFVFPPSKLSRVTVCSPLSLLQQVFFTELKRGRGYSAGSSATRR